MRDLLEKGLYTISGHAKLRQGERLLSLGDIKNIINTGYHEKRKDEYKEEYSDWNYAIRGKTLDDEQARICVALVKKERFVVITVIRLEA